MRLKQIFFPLFFFLICYFTHLFVVWTIESMYLNKMDVLDYFIPLIIIIVIPGVTFSLFYINEHKYSTYFDK